MSCVPPLLAVANEHWLTPWISSFTKLFPSGAFLSYSCKVEPTAALPT
jgi:hypothetical protein